ncbi:MULTISPECIES: DUF1772 domain-containing protein [Mesorhizobium]|uniref:DUF1772 domain-containing protein n=1 Tax=Mesorhizobium denitrificans TaxID=2294114 RepID=A0A371XEY6_9HYPH|nr:MULTISPECIES: anthrone oxygenase family protein [Mesorhizobium]RFC67786.1 DUF1772 domain-containing protein [Mesorhizobium denitrificans]
MAQLVLILTFIAALGSGLMAGLYFAFSNSVMSGLSRLPVPQGIAGMNHINVVIQNPAFFAVFMGTALIALALAALVFFTNVPKPAWVLIGAALFLLGNIAVTIAINVPMNDALAAAAPDSAEAAKLWSVYLDRWVFWNTVRFVACTGALAAFIVALM